MPNSQNKRLSILPKSKGQWQMNRGYLTTGLLNMRGNWRFYIDEKSREAEIKGGNNGFEVNTFTHLELFGPNMYGHFLDFIRYQCACRSLPIRNLRAYRWRLALQCLAANYDGNSNIVRS